MDYDFLEWNSEEDWYEADMNRTSPPFREESLSASLIIQGWTDISERYGSYRTAYRLPEENAEVRFTEDGSLEVDLSTSEPLRKRSFEMELHHSLFKAYEEDTDSIEKLLERHRNPEYRLM